MFGHLSYRGWMVGQVLVLLNDSRHLKALPALATLLLTLSHHLPDDRQNLSKQIVVFMQNIATMYHSSF
jgi:hypothetical protein